MLTRGLYIVYVRLKLLEFTKLLNLPLSILVKASLFRRNPPEVGLVLLAPLCMSCHTTQKRTYATLRAQCLARLPDHAGPLKFDGALLPRYVFIHGGPRVFTYYAKRRVGEILFHDYLDLSIG